MATGGDINDILAVFILDNLANITNDRDSIRFPLGLQSLIRTAVIDDIPDTAFPADFRELLVEYILVRERGDYFRFSRIIPQRRRQGSKKQRREFFR